MPQSVRSVIDCDASGASIARPQRSKSTTVDYETSSLTPDLHVDAARVCRADSARRHNERANADSSNEARRLAEIYSQRRRVFGYAANAPGAGEQQGIFSRGPEMANGEGARHFG